MAWEFVRLSNIRAFQLKSFDAMKRMLVENSPITASFQRANQSVHSKEFNIPGIADSWKVQFKSVPAIQALSQNQLDLFANGDEVDESKSAQVADIYPALPISDIPTTNHYDFVNQTGFATDTQLPHIHTLIEYNAQELSNDEFHGRMFKSLFTSLHCRAHQINADGELKQPLTAQCIGLDGRMFHFMCLQLNSTSFESDEGMKNMVWMSEPIPLFDKCSNTTWQSADYYTEYNPQAFRTFQAMWLNGLTI